MLYFVIKALVSGVAVAAVSTIARCYPALTDVPPDFGSAEARRGFWPSLGAACVTTMGLYLTMVVVAPKFGPRP